MTDARWALPAVGLILYAASGWYLSIVTFGTGALAWLALLGLPAALTAGTVALMRGTLGQIVWSAILSSALSALGLVAVIVWAGSQGVFQ